MNFSPLISVLPEKSLHYTYSKDDSMLTVTPRCCRWINIPLCNLTWGHIFQCDKSCSLQISNLIWVLKYMKWKLLLVVWRSQLKVGTQKTLETIRDYNFKLSSVSSLQHISRFLTSLFELFCKTSTETDFTSCLSGRLTFILSSWTSCFKN